MENKAEDVEIKTEKAEEKLERAGAEPGDAEKILDTEKVSGTEEKKEACEESKVENAEKTLAHVGDVAAEKTGEGSASVGEALAPEGEGSASVGETLAHAGEAATEKASAKDVGKKRDGKNKINSEKVVGSMELAAAFILVVLSGWLFFNTRGTRLLYVSVATGWVSRYYWVFLAAAVIFLAVGVFTLGFRCRAEGNVLQKEKGNLPGKDKEAEEKING